MDGVTILYYETENSTTHFRSYSPESGVDYIEKQEYIDRKRGNFLFDLLKTSGDIKIKIDAAPYTVSKSLHFVDYDGIETASGQAIKIDGPSEKIQAFIEAIGQIGYGAPTSIEAVCDPLQFNKSFIGYRSAVKAKDLVESCFEIESDEIVENVLTDGNAEYITQIRFKEKK